jgi:hypothetical protein
MILLSSDSVPTDHSDFSANFHLAAYNSTDKLNDDKLLTVAFKEIVLEVRAEKTKYMLLSRHQSSGQNRGIKTANGSFENLAQYKCFGRTVPNQILI